MSWSKKKSEEAAKRNADKPRRESESARMRRERRHGRNDIGDKIRIHLSSLMWRRLKQRSGSKEGRSVFDIVPYTLEELMSHLESKFTEGMSWENYGEWHIDHITPDAAWVYGHVEAEEFQMCWALSNLQPLWATENLTKGSNTLSEA